MIILSHYTDLTPYITRDGSLIRELMHPLVQGNNKQSLAEATIPPDTTTLLHKHLETEEIYHVTQGEGILRIGNNRLRVGTGDSILIPPGTPHNIRNEGNEDLKILCCCSPAYSHDDTFLLEADDA